jgi:hypothetical protein
LDGKYPGDEIWKKFCDRIGWRKDGEWLNHSDFSYSLSSAQGVLPGFICSSWRGRAFVKGWGAGGLVGVWVSLLSQRFVSCITSQP